MTIPIKENMLLSTGRGIEIIDINSILRIEAISNYSKVFFVGGRTFVVAKILSWFENKLPGTHFVRLHRSHLVNISYIKYYDNMANGKIMLANNEMIALAKRRRPDFKKAIYQYYEIARETNPSKSCAHCR